MLLAAGDSVGEDFGYGPARLIDADTIKDFASALKQFDLNTAIRHVDVKDMAISGVYGVWPELTADELEQEVRNYLEALGAFAQKAADERQGALVWLS
jgi:hypothetical protein